MENVSLSQKANPMSSEKKWLFSAPKFKTSGVENCVPEKVQLAIWSYIESRRNQQVPLDYLQVFTLRSKKEGPVTMQIIECSQEVPPYQFSIEFPSNSPIEEKIFVIDDVDHQTMLLAREY